MSDGITAAVREAEWDQAFARFYASVLLHLTDRASFGAAEGAAAALDAIRVPHGGRPSYKGRVDTIIENLRMGVFSAWRTVAELRKELFYEDVYEGLLQMPEPYEAEEALRLELWNSFWEHSPWRKPMLIRDRATLRGDPDLILALTARLPKGAKYLAIDPEALAASVAASA